MTKPNATHCAPPEFNPRRLVEAAILIDRARKKGNKKSLNDAIKNNRKLWADIHSLAAHPNNLFPKETCSELTRLSDCVCSKFRNKGADINDMVLDTLINIDLQISEGLLYRDRR